MGKTSTRPNSQTSTKPPGATLFAALTGIFLALAFWKFGNAIIFESTISAPNDVFELIYQPWPLNWGYFLIAILALLGIFVGKLERKKERVSILFLLLPLFWLAWQYLSATQTVDATLTRFTLKHFSACVVCFYLGRFALSRIESLSLVWIGMFIGFAMVLWVGWDQHFGGLERTREFFYQMPNWQEFPPEFLQKVASNRIYSTLFYPNTLAAVILLSLPISIAVLWSLHTRLTAAARLCLISIVGIAALACLFWSGSKSGWLLAMLLGFIALLHLDFNPSLKKGLIVTLLILGLGGFAVKYAKFFERGATSVVARFDYWRAAVQITSQHPALGTGPGTFFIPYQKIKRPEAEITRLCHNDYLEQASDSGVPGFLSFTLLVFGTVVFCRPKRDLIAIGVWLGLVGVCLHSLVEFNLYIPATAWPTFLFLGWLWGRRNQFDTQPVLR